MICTIATERRRLDASFAPVLSQAALAVAWLLAVAPLHAQTLPPLPSGAEPGRQAPPPVLSRPVPASAAVVAPGGSAAQAPAGADQLNFTLTEMAIEGVTAYPADVLRPLYAGLIGKTITVAEAFKVADAIERRYRGDGFVTSRVIVPEQAIEGGRFRIVVVEGFIADVVVEGDIGPARAAVDKLMAPLRGVKPINVTQVERQLLLANDVPGLTVRAALEPAATQTGGSVLVVRGERKPLDLAFSYGNRGTTYLESREMSASVAYNAVGERADRITVATKAAVPADRSTFIAGTYDALLTAGGTTLGLMSSYSTSHPGLELETLDVRSRVSSTQATVTYPWIRSREQNLRALGQLEVRDVDTDIGGAAFTRDRLRIARVGLSYDRTDNWGGRLGGITAARATLHQGLHALGASANGAGLLSRAEGRSDFTKVTAELTRLQQLTERTNLMATLSGQWSPHALLASEEMALGGASFGRAYDEGEVSAAQGVAASVEWRWSPPMEQVLPRGGQFYAYMDGGQLHAAQGAASPPSRTVSSLGGGVRANLGRATFATLELALPTSHAVRTRGDKHARAFFSISAQF
jgi:hemolysin activation/secretion protein